MMVNPIAVILEQARVWIIDPTAPTAAVQPAAPCAYFRHT